MEQVNKKLGNMSKDPGVYVIFYFPKNVIKIQWPKEWGIK